jgi:hypothetical protein
MVARDAVGKLQAEFALVVHALRHISEAHLSNA